MSARTCDTCWRWTRSDQPDESGHETGACELGFRCRPKFGCLEHAPTSASVPDELPWRDAAEAPQDLGGCLVWAKGDLHRARRVNGYWHSGTCFSEDVTHFCLITPPKPR